MSEQNVIGDVRSAKAWVDSQASTLAEHGERLGAVERAYRARTGEFASVPVTRPPAVQALRGRAGARPAGRFEVGVLRPIGTMSA
jgi:hypothetical protein